MTEDLALSAKIHPFYNLFFKPPLFLTLKIKEKEKKKDQEGER